MNDVLEGRYLLEVWDGDEQVAAHAQRNLIVNTGRNDYGTVDFDQLVRQCRVGMSSAPEASNQTDVQAEYTRLTSVGNRQVDGGFGDELARVSFNFATGQLNNVDVYEVGTFARGEVNTGQLDGRNARMYSRTVLRGTGGTPQALHVAGHQRLVVTFERRKTYPVLEQRVTIPIAGLGTYQASIVPTDRHFSVADDSFNAFTPASVDDLIVVSDPAFSVTPGNFTPELLLPGEWELLEGAVTPNPYTYNAFTRSKNALIDYARGNAGIKALVVKRGDLYPYALVFDEVVAKDDQVRLHLDLQLTWS